MSNLRIKKIIDIILNVICFIIYMNIAYDLIKLLNKAIADWDLDM
jgi:hypothetical protein